MASFSLPSKIVVALTFITQVYAAISSYVIVGAGPAGYILAERLSRKSYVQVTLIDAGANRLTDPLITVPSKYFFNQRDLYLYNSTTNATDPNAPGGPNLWQGKGLGGGTIVNAMVYCRGSSSVFDEWAQISGNSGLAWKNLLNDFKSSTTYQGRSVPYTQPVDSSVFGSGPLPVSLARTLYSFASSLASTITSTTNLGQIDTVNGAGIGWSYGLASIADSNRTRGSGQTSYGALFAKRSNVKVLTNSTVTRVTFDGTRATGVRYYDQDANRYRAISADEVIIAAGAINSAQILLLSGVGPRSDLKALNIPIVADVPGVGANLSDHNYGVIQYSAKSNVETIWQWSYNATEVAEANSEYAMGGAGPLGENNVAIYAYQRFNNSIFGYNPSSYYANLPKDRPHIGYIAATTPFNAVSPNISIVAAFAAVTQPEGRGSVKLRSTNPFQDPLITIPAFTNPSDSAVGMAGYKQLRSWMSAQALKSYLIEEIYPGPSVQTDDQLYQAMVNSQNSWHHPVGTTALGTVLTSNWRIKGLKGIRVVGSSSLPTIPTCPIQAAVYAAAVRAGEDIAAADS